MLFFAFENRALSPRHHEPADDSKETVFGLSWCEITQINYCTSAPSLPWNFFAVFVRVPPEARNIYV
jgi:hypothetical protein